MGRPPRGLLVVVAGPDGSGKTSVVEHLTSVVLGDRPVLHVHHRPRVLGGRVAPEGPVTEPHRHDPYPRWVSAAKVVFLFLDHLVGGWTRIAPHRRRGDHVVMERGWWDLLVDPRRYRLHPHPRLVAILGRLLPRPTVTLVLTAGPDVLARRTTELGPDELARQVAGWRCVPRRTARVREVDAARDRPDVLSEVTSLVSAARCSSGWIGLPTPQQPRWTVPRRPRRAVSNGLLVYTPVTPRGVLAWKLMRLLTRFGLGRLLPRTDAPLGVIDRVADVVPEGGTVAVGRGSHQGRCVALVLDHRGHPVVLVKLSDDARGADALDVEAEAAAGAEGRLPAPLASPRLLGHERGRLCFEAIEWSSRSRPWILPSEVAHALGRFFASAGTPDAGPSHGDLAPWNLLWTDAAWYLIDWSDARQDAPPFTDPIHFIVQAHALLRRPSRRAILQGLNGGGWVGACLRAYSEAAGLSLADARPALAAYLDTTIPEMDPATHDGRRGLAARRRLRRALHGPETS